MSFGFNMLPFTSHALPNSIFSSTWSNSSTLRQEEVFSEYIHTFIHTYICVYIFNEIQMWPESIESKIISTNLNKLALSAYSLFRTLWAMYFGPNSCSIRIVYKALGQGYLYFSAHSISCYVLVILILSEEKH